MEKIATCSILSKTLTIEIGNNFHNLIIIVACLVFAFKYIYLCSKNVDSCSKCKDRIKYIMMSRR